MTNWRKDRLGSAERGDNPTVLTRLTTGWAVMGDTQHLPGYCLLLYSGTANHLSELSHRDRVAFLSDLALLGEAVESACRELDPDFRRVNYEILGNTWHHLHGHVHARYEWEPEANRSVPVWRYDDRNDARYALGPQHDRLRAGIIREVGRLTGKTPRTT